MYSAAIRLFSRTFENLLVSLGTTWLSVLVFGICLPILIVISSVGHAVARRGWDSAKTELLGHFTMSGVLTVAIWVILFTGMLIRTIYKEHVALASTNTIKLSEAKREATEATQRAALAESQRDEATHALNNMLSVAEAFAVYRAAIGRDAPCEMKFSAPKETAELAVRISQLVTSVTNCKPTSVIESDMDPTTGEEARRGMVADKIVFHAAKEAKAVVPFFNALGNYLPMTRSYDVPKDAVDNFVWLQFGTDVRWVSQMR
jgi:hypothetical protein